MQECFEKRAWDSLDYHIRVYFYYSHAWMRKLDTIFEDFNAPINRYLSLEKRLVVGNITLKMMVSLEYATLCRLDFSVNGLLIFSLIGNMRQFFTLICQRKAHKLLPISDSLRKFQNKFIR